MDLYWLDLRGTSFDATPYLDGGGKLSVWRMPKAAHDLAKDFGYQKWMKLSGEEAKTVIPANNYPPSRFKT